MGDCLIYRQFRVTFTRQLTRVQNTLTTQSLRPHSFAPSRHSHHSLTSQTTLPPSNQNNLHQNVQATTHKQTQNAFPRRRRPPILPRPPRPQPPLPGPDLQLRFRTYSAHAYDTPSSAHAYFTPSSGNASSQGGLRSGHEV